MHVVFDPFGHIIQFGVLSSYRINEQLKHFYGQ